MLEEVLKQDPEFKLELQDPIPLENTPEFTFLNTQPLQRAQKTEKFIEEFDKSLEGKISKLTDYKIHAPQTLANAVRQVFGKTKEELTDTEALKLLLNPAQNPLLANTLNVNSLSKLSRCLSHAHYSFRKKLSHTADSQDQRHRTIPGSRPILANHYSGKPDYIIPQIVRLNPPILEAYTKIMEESFQSINQLLNENISTEQALYLLPNAFPIRFEESGDLLNLHHKWHTRACYTAQDEIFYATVDEIKEVSQVHPELSSHILAPCFIRKQANLKPVCPEGERFCGVKVWEKSIEDYTRLI